MSSVSEDAKKYELMVIVDADIGEKATGECFDKLRKNIAALNGEIFYEDDWGVRDLGYQIKKRDRGYYMVLDLLMEPEHIQDFDRKLRLDTEILRHMLMVLSAHYKPQSYAHVEEIEEVKSSPATERSPQSQKSPSGAYIKGKTGKIEDKKVSAVEVKESLPDVDPKIVAEAKVLEKMVTKEKISQKAQKESLENIDEKLSKILDNPDINL